MCSGLEIWKKVVTDDGISYDKYEVSSFGRIRSLNYNNTGEIRLLKPREDKNGYLRVNLSKNNKCKNYFIHRLVALAFLPNDDKTNKTQVNHIDENKQNNNINNLEWITPVGNIRHGTGIERSKKARFIDKKEDRAIRCIETGIIYKNVDEASEKTGLSKINIQGCCEKRYGCKTCGNFHWEYIN